MSNGRFAENGGEKRNFSSGDTYDEKITIFFMTLGLYSKYITGTELLINDYKKCLIANSSQQMAISGTMEDIAIPNQAAMRHTMLLHVIHQVNCQKR